MNTKNKETGSKEEIFNQWDRQEIKLCKTCKKAPDIYTVRDYLDNSRIHLIGINICCKHCKNELKETHKFSCYDPENETYKEIVKKWNLLNE